MGLQTRKLIQPLSGLDRRADTFCVAQLDSRPPLTANVGMEWNLDHLQSVQNAAQRVRNALELWKQEIADTEEKCRSQKQRQLDALREERQRRSDAQQEAIVQQEAKAVENERRKAELRRLARQAEVEARNARLAELAEIRRIEAERQRLAAEEAEAQAREDEERRRARLRECAVCMEEHDLAAVTQLQCRHWYCGEDLESESTTLLYQAVVFYSTNLADCVGAIRTACEERRPFQCCGQTILPDHVNGAVADVDRYRAVLEEIQEADPVYCCNRVCTTFLPSRLALGPDEVQCPNCGRSTCRHCKGPFHRNRECVADRSTQQARELARTQGWKACPRCQNMVEKSSGCLHMTCRCSADFCYNCGRPWSECLQSCSR